MQRLTQYFSYLNFSTTDVEKISSVFTPKSYKKGEYFASEGLLNPYIAFIKKGVFQYFFNKDGNEITTYVTGASSFAASLLCLLQEKPSQENIKAVTDVEAFIIHKKDFYKLREEIKGFNEFYTKIIEYQLVCIDESRFALLTQTAEERYENLLKKDPQLLQQIPLQFLASTLGITPRHLSRIRKNIK